MMCLRMTRAAFFLILITILPCYGIKPDSSDTLRNEIITDLRHNLLPFWIINSVDKKDPHEGFYGAIDTKGKGKAKAKRSLVLFARYLWSYSASARVLGDEASLQLAHRAFQYLDKAFRDTIYGGYFWELDAKSRVTNSSKEVYGQSFALYALAEYYRVTGEEQSLQLAVELFTLLEEKAMDPVYGGYLEAFSPNWSVPQISTIGKGDKTMNAHLHLLEAYTNLFRIWPDTVLRKSIVKLIDIYLKNILNPENMHQRLFFKQDWLYIENGISFGHDIEFSWLITEAAYVLGDSKLVSQIEDVAVKVARVQLDEGLNADGAMIYEKFGHGGYDHRIEWWVQAEAVVGFLNAWEISEEEVFLEAAIKVWKYIQNHIIDKEHGGWFPSLDSFGTPKAGRMKGNSWTCPYHNVRMGLEIYERLKK